MSEIRFVGTGETRGYPYLVCKKINLSYDVAVIQWITSCHKNCIDHTCNNTLACMCNVIDNIHVNNAFSHRIYVHIEGDKILF